MHSIFRGSAKTLSYYSHSISSTIVGKSFEGVSTRLPILYSKVTILGFYRSFSHSQRGKAIGTQKGGYLATLGKPWPRVHRETNQF